MEISKIENLRAEFKDCRPGLASMHIHCDIALIDRSTPANCQVYQLDPDFITDYSNGVYNKFDFERLDSSAFTLVGEMFSLDENTKVITLTNRNIFSYKHLVVFTGKDLPIIIADALNAIKDALLFDTLQLRAKISTQTDDQNSPLMHKFQRQGNPNPIKIPQTEGEKGHDIAASAKSLCQIKL